MLIFQIFHRVGFLLVQSLVFRIPLSLLIFGLSANIFEPGMVFTFKVLNWKRIWMIDTTSASNLHNKSQNSSLNYLEMIFSIILFRLKMLNILCLLKDKLFITVHSVVFLRFEDRKTVN